MLACLLLPALVFYFGVLAFLLLELFFNPRINERVETQWRHRPRRGALTDAMLRKQLRQMRQRLKHI